MIPLYDFPSLFKNMRTMLYYKGLRVVCYYIQHRQEPIDRHLLSPSHLGLLQYQHDLVLLSEAQRSTSLPLLLRPWCPLPLPLWLPLAIANALVTWVGKLAILASWLHSTRSRSSRVRSRLSSRVTSLCSQLRAMRS